MSNHKEQISKNKDQAAIGEEFEAAKKILANFLLTRKNFSLYPEGHHIAVNSLENFRQQLNEYLSKYNGLKLHIDKSKLIFQGETIHEEPPKDGSLPFTLFRDGIRWMEFVAGITTAELKDFLQTVNKYSLLSNEPEGDIVTDFWELQLPHIKYEATDFFLLNENDRAMADSSGRSSADAEAIIQESEPPAIEQSAKLNGRDRRTDNRQEASAAAASKPDKTLQSIIKEKLAGWQPITEAALDKDAVALTTADRKMIQEMVALAEEENPTAYLDALLDSLIEHQVKENFETILEVFEEELKSSLNRRDFAVTSKILESLHSIRNNNIARIAWAVPLIDDFFLAVSSPVFLRPLQDAWPEIGASQADKISRFLLLLQPAAVNTIGTLLPQTPASPLREMLVDVITDLSANDICPLESLLVNPDEKTAQSFLPVLIKLCAYGGEPLRILGTLTAHKSVAVRREAVKGILKINPAAVYELFNLIEDQDISIRRLILKGLSRSQDETAEKLLLEYLGNHKFKSTDSDHLIACYAALGNCGSSSSIPFLRQKLLSRGWMPGVKKSIQRRGAATALLLMDIEEAQEVLAEARRSIYPGVRYIVRKAKQEWK